MTHPNNGVTDPGWRYLGVISKRLRWTIAGAVVSGLAWQGAVIVAPLVIRRAVDSGILAGSRSALWWSCAALVALGAVEAAAGGSRHYFAIRNRALADANVRDSIFRRALELDARYHDRVGAAELISRASNDPELCPFVGELAGRPRRVDDSIHPDWRTSWP